MVSPEPVVLKNNSLVIKGHQIEYIGPTATLADTPYLAANDVQILDRADHILLPGLVNHHCHAAMSLFRGFADDLPLKIWLEQHIWPAEQQWVNEDFVQTGTQLAMAEMLLAGITSFTDMYFFPEITAKAALKAGMRAQLAAPIIEFPTPWGENAETHIHKTLALFDQFKHHDLIQIGFGPHAPYSVSNQSFEQIATLANELDTFIQLHLHETEQEIVESQQLYQQRPLERLNQLGLLSPQLQAVHLTQVNEHDIQQLSENNVSIVHCPASNLKLSSGFTPLNTLLNQNIVCTLGTDGAASNNNLNLLNDLKLTAQLAKAVAKDSSAAPAYEVLKMATFNAAQSLNRAETLGSLTAGKQADLILIDMKHPNTQPLYDPISQLVYATHSQQITDVWVAGQQLVSNRKLTTIDLEKTLTDAQQWGNRIGQS